MSVKWQTSQLRRMSILKRETSAEYCVEQIISTNNKLRWEKVFDEVVYPEESDL